MAAAVACATPQPVNPIPTQGTINRSITWVVTADAQRSCNQTLGTPLIGSRLACARLQGNQCTIYVTPPRDENDRQAIYILGHEALHCFAGSYHYAVN
jgi:hypothetical protein